MTPKRVEYIKKVVEKGAFTEIWVEELQEPEKTKELKKRNAVINRYLKKISAENQKKRKRKKYTKIKNFYFQKGDIISVEFEKGKFATIICYEIEQIKSVCYYVMFYLTGISNKQVKLNEINEKQIIGELIDGDTSGFGQALKNSSENEHDNIIKQYEEKAQKSITKEILSNIFKKIEKGKDKAIALESLTDHKAITLNREKYTKIGSCEFYEERIHSRAYWGYFSEMKDFRFSLEKANFGFQYQLEYPVDLLCKTKPTMTIIKEQKL